MKLQRRVLLSLLVGACAGVSAQTAVPAPPFREVMADSALLEQVRHGGFVLYMRHGTTDNSRADRIPQVDLNDCNTQRVLNEDGRKQAVSVGQALRRAKVPVGEIFHSPLCRTTETVQLAFPSFKGPIQANRDLMYTANLTTEEKKPVQAATRRLLSTPVAPGTNRVIVAHAPNLADVMGYFVKPEGTVVIIRPLSGDRFDYLASIPPDLWPSLLK